MLCSLVDFNMISFHPILPKKILKIFSYFCCNASHTRIEYYLVHQLLEVWSENLEIFL